jgi:mono/diheme cytochrome c family protein
LIRRKQAAAPAVKRSILGLAFVTLGLSGCTDAAGYDLDYFMSRASFVATMRRSVAYDASSLPRLPAEGSVPVISPRGGDDLPAFTQAALDSAAATLVNPLQPTEEVLARGAVVYQNQCFACHGAEGAGNGPVVGPGKFPLGPSLVTGTAAGRSEGYVYAVVRVGRGLMPAYGPRISHTDRWAVASYVSSLQGGGAPASAAAPGAVTTGAQPEAVAGPPAPLAPTTPPAQ